MALQRIWAVLWVLLLLGVLSASSFPQFLKGSLRSEDPLAGSFFPLGSLGDSNPAAEVSRFSLLENDVRKEGSQDEEKDSSPEEEELPIHDLSLDAEDSSHLFWQVNHRTQEVRVEVHSKDLESMPWMGLGFSDYGDLKGADLCVLWTDWKGRINFQNALVDPEGRMVVPEAQGCHHFNYRIANDVMKFTFTRDFDTCEPGHYIIERGTTHVVWVTGEGPLYTLSGVSVMDIRSGMVRVELLKPNLPQADLNTPDVKRIVVASVKAEVPSQETTYICTVHKLPDSFEEKHHILQFRPVIEKKNEDIVHHMEVFHCEHPPDFEVPLYKGPCHADTRPREVDACKRVLAAWAMGATEFKYPPDAGLPIGGKDFNPFVMLEVHYNNPQLLEGRVDSSGMELLYTLQLRPHDAGIMELGLEYTGKMAIPPHYPSFVVSGYCIPECTALGIPKEGIYFFGSQLHTHLNGVRTWTSHLRGGRQLPDLNRDNHYSNHFQEIRRLPRLVHVLPGDALIMTCDYRTMARDNVTLGGFSISDEMCVNYVHYFPKVDLEVCKSSIDTKTLIEYFEFMREWELQPTSPDLTWEENYRSIEWTPLRASMLHDLYEEAPISMQCNKSDGDRFPGYWEGMPLPRVTHPLPVEERRCPTKK